MANWVETKIESETHPRWIRMRDISKVMDFAKHPVPRKEIIKYYENKNEETFKGISEEELKGILSYIKGIYKKKDEDRNFYIKKEFAKNLEPIIEAIDSVLKGFKIQREI